MTGKKFADSVKIRAWIERALKAGCDSPRAVLEYIEQHTTEIQAPSIPTIGNIMKEEGYEPVGYKWEKVD